MFDELSRYSDVDRYEVVVRRGRSVRVISTPRERAPEVRGTHLMRQGQRLDLLAARYLDDPAGYWNICEVNGAMLPESLSEAVEIAIPMKGL